MSYDLQDVEAAENSKMKEQCANVAENKGSAFSSAGPSGNVIENKSSYGQNTGMLMKRKGVIGNAESHATGKRPGILPVSADGRSSRSGLFPL
jgi:hypothetical protein